MSGLLAAAVHTRLISHARTVDPYAMYTYGGRVYAGTTARQIVHVAFVAAGNGVWVEQQQVGG